MGLYSICVENNRLTVVKIGDLIYVSLLCLSTDRSYLSLDWEPEMKKKYFDETVVEVKPISGSIL